MVLLVAVPVSAAAVWSVLFWTRRRGQARRGARIDEQVNADARRVLDWHLRFDHGPGGEHRTERWAMLHLGGRAS